MMKFLKFFLCMIISLLWIESIPKLNSYKCTFSFIKKSDQKGSQSLYALSTQKLVLRIAVPLIVFGNPFIIRSFATDTTNIVEQSIDSFDTEVEAMNRKLARESREKISLPRTKRNSLLNSNKQIDDQVIENSIIKVLTLKPYLDEIERNLFQKKWEKLFDYLFVIQEQDEAFATLINNLFPTMDPPDIAARESLRYEGKSIFFYLEMLGDAARKGDFVSARFAYARLLYAYDKFLKAGTLYPTYDPIASYDIFYRSIPEESLKFDRVSKVQILDRVVLMKGPDMGRAALLINIENDHDREKAIVKFDYDGKAYQEVKMVDYSWLAKAAPDPGKVNN